MQTRAVEGILKREKGGGGNKESGKAGTVEIRDKGKQEHMKAGAKESSNIGKRKARKAGTKKSGSKESGG